jgi:hypothetical protein
MAEAENWYWQKTWSDFRRGRARLHLKWQGGSAEAVIYDHGVPQTAAAILRHLPLEVPVVHVAWSGDMVMSSNSYKIGVDQAENHVRLVRPGDISWDPKFGELAFTYGTAECKLPSGPNTVVVYGQIVEGLEEFAAFGRARRFEGLGKLSLSAG